MIKMKPKTRKPSVARVRMNGRSYVLLVRTPNGRHAQEAVVRDIESIVKMWPSVTEKISSLEAEIDHNEKVLREVNEVHEDVMGFNERLKVELTKATEDCRYKTETIQNYSDHAVYLERKLWQLRVANLLLVFISFGLFVTLFFS
jgi:hypothetical protein